MTSQDSNAHRKGKRRFEGALTPEESQLVNRAKAKLNVATDRQLILALCNRLFD